MIRITVLASLALFALASPVFSQDGVFDRLDKLEARFAKVEAAVADLPTIKMNINAMAAKIDSLDAKFERLSAGKTVGEARWSETSAPARTSTASSGWGTSSTASVSSGYASGGMVTRAVSRPVLFFPRLRGGACAGGG